jgi:thioredoxin 2
MTDQLHVVCPHCAATNRVPANKPAAEAVCGACKARLFDGTPTEVDPAGFDRHIRVNGIPVLVDIWAPWCGPCRSMAPNFARAATMLEPGMRLLKLNADTAPEIGARYGVRGIPALLLFKGGQLAGQTAGAMAAEQIVGWARQHAA